MGLLLEAKLMRWEKFVVRQRPIITDAEAEVNQHLA
jgi:hypothetical protein